MEKSKRLKRKLKSCARICVSGLASAEETRDLVSINAEKAEGFLRRLDQRAPQGKIDSR